MRGLVLALGGLGVAFLGGSGCKASKGQPSLVVQYDVEAGAGVTSQALQETVGVVERRLERLKGRAERRR